jgi:hypothetical protein
METDPVSEALCFLVFRIPDDGQSWKTQYFCIMHHRQTPLESSDFSVAEVT